MDMRAYEELKDKLCAELEEIAEKPEMSAGDLEMAHKLTDTIKNIHKIEMYEGEGYASDGGWRAEGNYSRRYDQRAYDERGNSYAGRNGMHYVRGHYSRAEGRDMMMDRMREIMNDPEMNAEDKKIIRDAMNKLQR